MPKHRKGSYGIDGPIVWPVMLALIVAAGGGAAVFHSWGLLALGGALAVVTGNGLHTSLRGKFVVWARILEELELRGDERVLDVGCGRGAVLLLVARRLPAGRAVGIDLWKRGDQWGNSARAALDNAVREGVADRIEVRTADMTALPFAEASFDVVVSNLAIHNVPSREGRDRAIAEAVRVLRPGGRLLIADMGVTRQYRECLVGLGMAEVSRRDLGGQMWWFGPLLRTFLVTGRKG